MALSESNSDDRLEDIETVRINWTDFKKALRNDYLTDTDEQRGGHSVLRLRPPFKGELEAEYHFSRRGTRYVRGAEPNPIHIRPHLIIQTGRQRGWSNVAEYPTRASVRSTLSEEAIEDAGGIEEAVEESRKLWWEELRHQLPDEFDLGKCIGPSGKRVDIEWIFDDE